MNFRRLNLPNVAEVQLPLSWLEKQRRQGTAICGDVENAPSDKPSTLELLENSLYNDNTRQEARQKNMRRIEFPVQGDRVNR